MTDSELRDAAVAELKLTTAGWRKPNGQPNYPSGVAPTTTHWGKAMPLLAQIGQSTPPPPGEPTGYYYRGDFRAGGQDFSAFDTHDVRFATFTDWAVGQTKDAVIVAKPAGSIYPWSNYMARIICNNALPSSSQSGQNIMLWETNGYGAPWVNGNELWSRAIIVLPNGKDPRYPGKITPVNGDGVSKPFHVLVEWHKNDDAGAIGPTSSKLEIGWGQAGPCLLFHPFGAGDSTWMFETDQVQTEANGVGGSTGAIGGTFIPLKFNHEYDLLWRWKLSPDPAVGQVDWYVDGVLRGKIKMPTLFKTSSGAVPGISFQSGIYRNFPTYLGNVTQTTNENEHMYIVAMLSGPTRASVGG